MKDPRIAHAEALVARFSVNGVAVSDFFDVIGSIESWDDWCGAWSKRAKIHEDLGRTALESGNSSPASCSRMNRSYGLSLFRL